ncbi:ROK family protein [Paenibacillus albiflavus]|uniref:ROK family protein n=1 Tax=Paenibacillus albiflavus TaxID=2545760 RepID=A0A4R4EQZ5_9BACL|nr:ROK family protein [Paenibacillus albiflavus]TCZ80945.1 ROK family protein [Paenibacillus albiflavus]
MEHWIGIDLGGTNVVVGLLNDEMKLISKIKRSTGADQGSEFVLSQIAEMVDEVLELNHVDKNDLRGIGMGSPGFIDPIRGVCLLAVNLGWKDYPVAARLQELTGKPVFIDNDVRMYVYGEAMNGASQGHDCVFGITLGTGIAGAFVDHGQLFYGGGFMAGEVGHIPMDGEHHTCGCGLKGCLETVASANGIARQAREALAVGRASLMQQKLVNDPQAAITAVDVSKAYDDGDELAIEIMNHTGKVLGKALASVVTLFSPDCIVIGGGAAQAGERLFAPMREEIKNNVISFYWDKLTIVPGQLIDDGGVIGSASYAKSRLS